MAVRSFIAHVRKLDPTQAVGSKMLAALQGQGLGIRTSVFYKYARQTTGYTQAGLDQLIKQVESPLYATIMLSDMPESNWFQSRQYMTAMSVETRMDSGTGAFAVMPFNYSHNDRLSPQEAMAAFIRDQGSKWKPGNIKWETLTFKGMFKRAKLK